MQSEGYSLPEVGEVWWVSTWDWSPSMTGYRLFMLDRLGCGGGGVALLCESSGVACLG